MPREKTDYRDILERLDTKYPDKELLTRGEIASFLGITRQAVYNRYGDRMPAGVKISKTMIARLVSS